MKLKIAVLLFLLWGDLGAQAHKRENRFDKHSGVVYYTDYAPFAARPVGIYYHIPRNADPATAPVLFLIPGSNRDAESLLNAVRSKLDELGVICFALEFKEKDYPLIDYQEMGIVDNEGIPRKRRLQTTELPDRIFRYIRAHSDIRAEKYDLYGHSAGGQFIHRFLLFHDSPLVNRAMVGSPGWYTFPDPARRYPYGVQGTRDAGQRRIRRFLRKQVVLHLGAADTVRESYLRKTPEAEAQGHNRLERGRTFYDFLRDAAAKCGQPLSWGYLEAEGVPHRSDLMALRGLDYLYGHPEPAATDRKRR